MYPNKPLIDFYVLTMPMYDNSTDPRYILPSFLSTTSVGLTFLGPFIACSFSPSALILMPSKCLSKPNGSSYFSRCSATQYPPFPSGLTLSGYPGKSANGSDVLALGPWIQYLISLHGPVRATIRWALSAPMAMPLGIVTPSPTA